MVQGCNVLRHSLYKPGGGVKHNPGLLSGCCQGINLCACFAPNQFVQSNNCCQCRFACFAGHKHNHICDHALGFVSLVSEPVDGTDYK